MSHRQFLAWQAHIEAMWNEPDRSDFYAMQIASAHGVKEPYIDFNKLRSRAATRVNRITEQNYLSTTDDPSSWWVPGPLTEEQYLEVIKRKPRVGK